MNEPFPPPKEWNPTPPTPPGVSGNTDYKKKKDLLGVTPPPIPPGVSGNTDYRKKTDPLSLTPPPIPPGGFASIDYKKKTDPLSLTPLPLPPGVLGNTDYRKKTETFSLTPPPLPPGISGDYKKKTDPLSLTPLPLPPGVSGNTDYKKKTDPLSLTPLPLPPGVSGNTDYKKKTDPLSLTPIPLPPGSLAKTEFRPILSSDTPIPDPDLPFKILRAQIQKQSTSAPFSYKAPVDSRPTAKIFPQELDNRPTENISAEELKRELEAQKKLKEQSPPTPPSPIYDQRNTEFIPISELQQQLQEQKKTPLPILPFEGIPPNFRIYNYYLGFTPLGSGADAYVFDVFSDEQRSQLTGVMKIARKGHQNQLFKEIEFAKQCVSREIGHENIVVYLQTGVTSFGQPFLLTERLFPYPRPQLLFVDAVCIFSRMADLFSYLHRIRLYHRDIKPGNILYQFYGIAIIPKLFDFGTVSKQIQEKETAACSPYFAAPEVLRKIRGLTTEEIQFSRADIYSLGMTFLGLLGFNPYLTVTPALEVKYRDPRALIDQMNFMQENQSAALNDQIEKFLIGQHWDTSYVFAYGIRSNHYKALVDGLIPLLKKVLHPKPEERPLASALQKSLETLITTTLNCSAQQYLLQGGSLFAEGPRLE